MFPEWAELSVADFEFDDPRGFSSFTMGIRSTKPVQPVAVLYRRLEGKDNAILDFEFSCLNHRAYDFANLFAETVMRHQQPDYPYFRIAEPEFGDRELGMLIDYYLDNATFEDPQQRVEEFNRLLTDSRRMLMMSDYKYAMAALPLAVNPIQKIRFIPYAHHRFNKFLAACEQQLNLN